MHLAGQRLVELSKVTNYLLNVSHPDGAAKARFFEAFGFDPREPAKLIDALATHPSTNHVIVEIVGVFGTKSVVQCTMHTPDGRDPCIRTVWIRDDPAGPHRLVTAYPHP